LGNNSKKANRAKLALTLRLRVVFYPLIYFADKFNVLKFFSGYANTVLRFLKIKKVIGGELGYRIYSRLAKNQFTNVNKIKSRKVVLFPMMYGVESSFNLRNILIAKYFMLKGFRPVFLICDGTFGICNHDRIGKNRALIPLFCTSCFKNYKYVADETGIEVKYLSEYFSDTSHKLALVFEEQKINSFSTISELENYYFDGRPLGRLTKTSVLRFFYRGDLKGISEEVAKYKKFLIQSVKMHLICQEIFQAKDMEIEKVILLNGALSFDLVISDECKRRGIDYLTQEAFVGSNSWIYKKNGIAIHLDWAEEYEKYSKVSLTENQKLDVINLFNGFKSGKVIGIKFNEGTDHSLLNQIRSGEKYVVLYTNLNFDSYVLGRNPIFSSMYEWVVETIDFWNKNIEGVKLIIRAHPAELKLLTPTEDFVGEIIIDKLSEKIIFFDSNTNLNSYELFDKVEYALCYSSTIGIELSLANVPTIIAGESFYKEYVNAPKNKDEYFNLIKQFNIEPIACTGSNRDKLIHFLYFIYFVQTKHFKGFDVDRNNGQHIYENIPFADLFEQNKTILKEFYDYTLGFTNND
jgi:hypothetical protein